MKKFISHVRTHQDIFLEGIGSFGNTLPSKSKTIPDLVLSTCDEGVTVEASGREAIIPYANIVVMTVDKARTYPKIIAKKDEKVAE